MHQFRFAQFANKALSNTYFAILALLELCKIICFPSLCSGTKYISTARSARCANKVSFRFNFYGLANFVYMLPFTTRWIKKYILLPSGVLRGRRIVNPILYSYCIIMEDDRCEFYYFIFILYKKNFTFYYDPLPFSQSISSIFYIFGGTYR